MDSVWNFFLFYLYVSIGIYMHGCMSPPFIIDYNKFVLILMIFILHDEIFFKAFVLSAIIYFKKLFFLL